jgi:hypothetical protein
MAGEKDDCDLLAERFSKLAADLVAADFGQVDLYERERRLQRARRIDSLAPGLDLLRLVADSAKQARNPLTGAPIVVGNEYRAKTDQNGPSRTIRRIPSGPLTELYRL